MFLLLVIVLLSSSSATNTFLLFDWLTIITSSVEMKLVAVRHGFHVSQKRVNIVQLYHTRSDQLALLQCSQLADTNFISHKTGYNSR